MAHREGNSRSGGVASHGLVCLLFYSGRRRQLLLRQPFRSVSASRILSASLFVLVKCVGWGGCGSFPLCHLRQCVSWCVSSSGVSAVRMGWSFWCVSCVSWPNVLSDLTSASVDIRECVSLVNVSAASSVCQESSCVSLSSAPISQKCQLLSLFVSCCPSHLCRDADRTPRVGIPRFQDSQILRWPYSKIPGITRRRPMLLFSLFSLILLSRTYRWIDR